VMEIETERTEQLVQRWKRERTGATGPRNTGIQGKIQEILVEKVKYRRPKGIQGIQGIKVRTGDQGEKGKSGENTEPLVHR